MIARTPISKRSSCTAEARDLRSSAHESPRRDRAHNKYFTLKILVVAVALWATRSAFHREADTMGIATGGLLFR